MPKFKCVQFNDTGVWRPKELVEQGYTRGSPTSEQTYKDNVVIQYRRQNSGSGTSGTSGNPARAWQHEETNCFNISNNSINHIKYNSNSIEVKLK